MTEGNEQIRSGQQVRLWDVPIMSLWNQTHQLVELKRYPTQKLQNKWKGIEDIVCSRSAVLLSAEFIDPPLHLEKNYFTFVSCNVRQIFLHFYKCGYVVSVSVLYMYGRNEA